MFEKEAEEILNNHCDCELLSECMTGIRCRCSDFEEEKKLLLEGIKFGYNKANEWHKVADGDLPSEEGGWVCNQNGLPCFFDWGTEQWLDCEGTQIRTTEWCHMPHKE